MLNVRSVTDLIRSINKNLHRIDRNAFDVIVGIPRSGMIPASIIATQFQLPLADLNGFANGIVSGRSGRTFNRSELINFKRVLLVDDTANKGGAMEQALEQLRNLPIVKITRLAVYGPYKEEFKNVVDIAFEECTGPRVFAWNLWKHIRLARWGFDFDGVFCPDPTREENDDGSRYLRFMATSPQLNFPTRGIGHVITGRLERYRDPTIAQLKRYGIQFDSLTMMPYATKAERMAVGGRGMWKAEQIKRLGLEFYIESSLKQATVIAREANIPVWCVETQEVIPCSI